MRPRLATLKRLVSLYEVVEEMHVAELQRMTAAVQEAQKAIGVQQEVTRAARFDGRGALIVGDSVGRTLAETQREIARWKRERLEKLHVEREQLSDAAREQYVLSRLRSEQLQRVVSGLTERMELEEGRRGQAASDDRFLARRRWTDAQDELSTGTKMKAS